MESAVGDPEAWDLTIIRAHGLRLMRPEKAWRPIVTLEVDKQSRHEAVLGVDGQNPNLKQCFRFYDVKQTSTVSMHIWHRSQSKKKSKKRNLVASATHSLGDLLRRVEGEKGVLGKGSKTNVLDIRLHCQSCSTTTSSKKHTPSSKGHPQSGALITIKLTPPRSSPFHPPSRSGAAATHLGTDTDIDIGDEGTSAPVSGYTTDASVGGSSVLSVQRARHEEETKPLIDVQPPSPLSSPVEEEVEFPTPPGLSGLRRRRPQSSPGTTPTSTATTATATRRRRKRCTTKGYKLYSEDEPSEFSYSDSSECVSASEGEGSSSFFGDKTPTLATRSISVSQTPVDMDEDIFHLPAVRKRTPHTDDDDKKGGLGLDIPSAPQSHTISLISSSTHTTTTKTTTETRSTRTITLRGIAASLLPQHILSYTSSSNSLGPVEPRVRAPSPARSSSSCDSVPVPPYSERDVSAPISVSVGKGKGKAREEDELELQVDEERGERRVQEEMEGEEEGGGQGKNEWWEVFLGNFTLYLNLRNARTDSDFEAVLHQLKMEWTFMGGFLAAIGAVDVAIFAISTDSIVSLSPLSLSSVALSSIFTGLGVTSLAYFILRYYFSPAPLFRLRALDVYASYAFFSFLVYGCHMFVKGVIGVVRRVVGALRVGVGKVVGAPSAPAPAPAGSNDASLRRVRAKWKNSKRKVERKTAGASVEVGV
ncbi:hypothetical protein MD484_g6415, partial [Candolleomyces efflorescens]